jgi:hypothetical protein
LGAVRDAQTARYITDEIAATLDWNRAIAMPQNYVVLRNSPDWLSYGSGDADQFVRRMGFQPETLISDYMRVWDSTFAVPYRIFRHEIKTTATATNRAVADSIFLSHSALREKSLDDDDLLVFVDDDDWLMPDLFTRLREFRGAHDGMKWGSIRLGVPFEPHGVLQIRSIDRAIYTNNYAVTGRTVARLGFDAVFEHGAAQAQFDNGLYQPLTISEHLSATIKHPCSTVVIRFCLNPEIAAAGLRPFFVSFNHSLEQISLPPELQWMAGPFATFRRLLDRALVATSRREALG